MHGNSNFERTNRNTQRNTRPPGGEQGENHSQPTQKRGKSWTRENDKREQSQFFNTFE